MRPTSTRLSSVLALCLTFLLLPAHGALLAQASPDGTWEGTVQVPRQSLGVTVVLEGPDEGAAADAWTGSVDIPMQGATDVPLTDVAVRGDSVRFAISGVPGEPTFRGTLSDEGDEITGDFTQAGQAFPFRLERADRAAAADAAGADEAREDPLAGYGEYVESQRETWNVPGVAVAIVKDGEVVHAEGYGLRDRDSGDPVTADTRFAIGSASKAFTAMTVGIMVEEGLLEWDEPIREHLPEFRLESDFATSEMTPRDLLTHRSGLPRHELLWYGSDASREELVERVRWLEPSADFRTRFQYQNLMYATAGRLVGQVAGGTWEDVVRERIFAPLGMTSSSVSDQDPTSEDNFALGYREAEGSDPSPIPGPDPEADAAENEDAENGDDAESGSAAELERAPYRDISSIGPAGSINSNVRDLTRWLRLHLQRGTLEDEEIISSDLIEEVQTPQVVVDSDVFHLLLGQPEMPYIMYGLGWFVQPYRGHPMVHHGGNIDGYSALVSFLPRDGIGIAILTNRDGTLLPYVLALHAYDRMLGLEEVAWSDRFRGIWNQVLQSQQAAAGASEETRVTDAPPSHDLDAYTGTYRHPAYGDLVVERSDDGLRTRYNDVSTGLEHWHYDVFRISESMLEGTRVQFHTNLRGDIAALSVGVEPSVSPQRFERQPPEEMRDPDFLRQFTGEYDLQGYTVTVSLRGDGTLIVSLPGQPTQELEPYLGTTFEVSGQEGYSVEFVREDGRVTAAIFQQPNGAFTAEKTE